ncbi:AAA family ATPase [Actinoplanes sp. NPDC051861]|uniref:AAA family ATPase n=1 Tax=Actinoplanes sp. NPDC051861 TaxID=3155170 RepID=UPI003414CBE2
MSMPVLWLTGTPGAGKTTVAWALREEQRDVGFVDIDQINMCYPETARDPGRFGIAADNLVAVAAGHRAAGARALIVSGCVDPGRGVLTDRLPGLTVTRCHLRAAPEVLRRRLVGRNAGAGFVEAALTAPDHDDGIDTSGLTVAEVVALVKKRTTGWLDSAGEQVPPEIPHPPGGRILWLCGATGVGKSTAGFDVYLRRLPGAYVDLDQIGFAPGGHEMRARILAGMWHTFHRAGAETLTMVGPAEDAAAIATYARALPAATLTVARLHASPGELHDRIQLRRHLGGWAQPGDPLIGRLSSYLSEVARSAAAEAAALERTSLGDLRIDTDGLSARQVADTVMAAIAEE